MLVFGWLMYGLLLSSVIVMASPQQTDRSAVVLIFLAGFLLLGGIDYIASNLSRLTRRSIKFRWF